VKECANPNCTREVYGLDKLCKSCYVIALRSVHALPAYREYMQRHRGQLTSLLRVAQTYMRPGGMTRLTRQW
jgi:hypothetical protein